MCLYTGLLQSVLHFWGSQRFHPKVLSLRVLQPGHQPPLIAKMGRVDFSIKFPHGKLPVRVKPAGFCRHETMCWRVQQKPRQMAHCRGVAAAEPTSAVEAKDKILKMRDKSLFLNQHTQTFSPHEGLHVVRIQVAHTSLFWIAFLSSAAPGIIRHLFSAANLAVASYSAFKTTQIQILCCCKWFHYSSLGFNNTPVYASWGHVLKAFLAQLWSQLCIYFVTEMLTWKCVYQGDLEHNFPCWAEIPQGLPCQSKAI